MHGEVAQVDHFGNLTLNVQAADLEAAGMHLGDDVELRVGGKTLRAPFRLTYGEVAARPAGRLRGLLPHHHHRGQPGQRGRHAARPPGRPAGARPGHAAPPPTLTPAGPA